MAINKDTLPELWHPLMRAPSIHLPHCAVCGKSGHLEQHHMIKRSAGIMHLGGVEIKKPTITLCGHGNADGCHGMAHGGLLFFRWAPDNEEKPWRIKSAYAYCIGGHVEYLITDEPTDYQTALAMDGWSRLRTQEDVTGHIYGARS